MKSPRLLCAGALVEIARILMQKRGQNSVADQASVTASAKPAPNRLPYPFAP